MDPEFIPESIRMNKMFTDPNVDSLKRKQKKVVEPVKHISN